MKDSSEVRAEFDAIARAAAERPDPAGLYDSFLESLIPEGCLSALDIGCGTGRFTRRLALRARHVTAIDVSPEMVAVARRRTSAANVEYRVADVMAMAPALGQFDCVVTLSTFHHLPQEPAVAVLKSVVTPGGIVLLHDLWRFTGVAGRAWDAVRVPYKVLRLLQLGAPLRHTSEERAAWRRHEQDDVHLTRREVRELRDRCFPDATLHEHFLWRYTLAWVKPRRTASPT